eukprot:TRINITY_DN1799_c0_g1_i2.p1 TRINITY_DN1799_c0_g1~~TRINITY_DN1799_c0_g1_i2.p1  ORF type:complete len:242 (-),score=45.07 TRINITY_DN1799_c0_g1_i2:205-930(-)
MRMKMTMVSYGLVSMIALLLVSLYQINAQPTPIVIPSFPEHFVTNWTIYNVLDASYQLPYFNNTPPTGSFYTGTGATFYDWSRMSMREEYYDFCVPIFESGYNWTCDFLNTKNVSYLILHEDRPKGYPSCCIFAKPFFPPAPNFIEVANITFNISVPIWADNEKMWEAWWMLPAPDIGGPFGIGWSGVFEKDEEPSPRAFFFGGIPGWVQQVYFNWENDLPDDKVWQIPDDCLTAQMCKIE